jgi:hypothetical protein
MSQSIVMLLLAFKWLPTDAGMTKLVNLTLMLPQKNPAVATVLKFFILLLYWLNKFSVKS